jgi:hypothetical protein
LPVGTYGRPDDFVAIFNGPRTLDDLWIARLQDARPDQSLSVECLALPAHVIDPDGSDPSSPLPRFAGVAASDINP